MADEYALVSKGKLKLKTDSETKKKKKKKHKKEKEKLERGKIIKVKVFFRITFEMKFSFSRCPGRIGVNKDNR